MLLLLTLTGWLAERFSDYISNYDEKPFFVFLGFPDPHAPISPCEEIAKDFESSEVLEPVDPEGKCRPYKNKLKTADSLSTEQRKDIRRYTDAMINGIDRAVGKIISALKEREILDDTIIVYTSDHGDFLCDYALRAKQNVCSDVLVHVPFIIRAPGSVLSGRSDIPMSNTDVMPTVMSLAGLSASSDIDGVDITEVVNNGLDHQAWAYAFAEDLEYQNMALYEGNLKFLYYPKCDKVKLYNLDDDPYELNDLSKVESYKELTEKFKSDSANALMKHTRAVGHRVSPY